MKPLADERAQCPAPRAGFALPRDILIAPARAYASIKARPEWLPAAFVVLVLSIATTILVGPAFAHVTRSAVSAVSAPGAAVPARALDDAIKEEEVNLLFNQTFIQVAAWTITAMVLTTASRLRGQATSFATYFSLAANCGIPLALDAALQGLIIRAHDPAHYVSLNQLNTAFPLSLAAFDPHGTVSQIGYLSQFDVFFLWTGLLIAYGYMAISGEKLLRALFLAFGIAFSLTLLAIAVQPQ